jgi:hypothetical protein
MQQDWPAELCLPASPAGQGERLEGKSSPAVAGRIAAVVVLAAHRVSTGHSPNADNA